MTRSRALATKIVHGTKSYDQTTGAVSEPIYQSATFRHPALHETTGYDYTRLQNPTRKALEDKMALLESGARGFAFSSGMAAITTLIKIFKPGDHIIVSDDVYGGTFRLFNEVYSGYGFTFSFVDTTNLKSIEAEITSLTKAIFIETPSNPTMKVTSIEGIVAIAKKYQLVSIVDNTFLSPFFQQPLTLGVDFVIHSATKYLGGHNDTLAGIIVAKDETYVEKIELIQKSEGAVLSPFDSWLILRGIKTLGIRMAKQSENADKIARWLMKHPLVENVHYPGIETHPGHLICKRQASGFGAMLSFNVKDINVVAHVLKHVQTIIFAESLGGIETLITYPTVQTHAAVPEEIRKKLGVTDTLLRLSVGIEDVDDLIEDLKTAIAY